MEKRFGILSEDILKLPIKFTDLVILGRDIDMEQLVYVKDVDKSVLTAGFTIKAALLNQFIGCFGELNIGEKRSISISLNGILCSDIMVINQPFNREKYPDHPEMYQVRYSVNSEFARNLRFIFKDLWDYIDDQQSLQKEIKLLEGKKRNIRIPLEKRCQLAFYMGEDPNIWRAETIYPHEFKQIQSELSNYNISELEFEDWQKYDNASIKIKTSDIKIRILDKKIGDNLKVLYEHRCHICGEKDWYKVWGRE